MRCEKCGAEFMPPKNLAASFTNCPFCKATIFNETVVKSYASFSEFLQYIVSIYGQEIYEDKQRLNGLIADFYNGEERMKRAYVRAIQEDSLSQRIYNLSLKSLNEREAFYNQVVTQFAEANFYSQELGKQVVDSFIKGINLTILQPVSTKATEEDGQWVDECGVMYSANRKKLIKTLKHLFNSKRYEIPMGTICICDDAFSNCSSLTDINIPSSVTNIGENAFCDCSSLTNIDIPSSVTAIGSFAFCNCFSLTNITIPSSVTSIRYATFIGCSSLTSINISPSVTDIGEEAFSGCSSLTSINIPSSVTNIGGCAFLDCLSLTNINIPSSVTDISECAFAECSSLTSIDIPSSITSIESGVFIECSSLKNINIPSSVTDIGEEAFAGCSSLTSINIPHSVIWIGDGAFAKCPSLTNINIPKGSTDKFKKLLDKEFHHLLKEAL